MFIKFKINDDRADHEIDQWNAITDHRQSAPHYSPWGTLISGRRYSRGRRRNHRHRRLVGLSVSHELIRSFPQLSHALCVFFLSIRKRSFLRGVYFPRTFSYVTIHSCYTSRVSIPAVLRDRTTVINPRIFPVGQTPGIQHFELIVYSTEWLHKLQIPFRAFLPSWENLFGNAATRFIFLFLFL